MWTCFDINSQESKKLKHSAKKRPKKGKLSASSVKRYRAKNNDLNSRDVTDFDVTSRGKARCLNPYGEDGFFVGKKPGVGSEKPKRNEI